MNILPVGVLIWMHVFHPHPIRPFDGPSAGTLINLESSDKDAPQDNGFQMVGPTFTVDELGQVLNNELPTVFNGMHPSTNDPTIRNVTLTVSGNDIEFGFQKHVAFLWDQVNIDASTSVNQTSCADPSQTGLEIIFTMLGSTSTEAQGYVNGARILICSQVSSSADGPTLNVTIERDLYAGAEYEDWIGSLMGDFLRNFGPALGSALIPGSA